jgi:hypothetical protein
VIGSKYLLPDKAFPQGCVLLLDDRHEVSALNAVGGNPLDDVQFKVCQPHIKQLHERFSWRTADKKDIRFQSSSGGAAIWLDDDLKFQLVCHGKQVKVYDRARNTSHAVVDFPFLVSTLTLNRKSGGLIATFFCKENGGASHVSRVLTSVALVNFSHNRVPVSLLDFMSWE